jgi:hypothetical protein
MLSRRLFAAVAKAPATGSVGVTIGWKKVVPLPGPLSSAVEPVLSWSDRATDGRG